MDPLSDPVPAGAPAAIGDPVRAASNDPVARRVRVDLGTRGRATSGRSRRELEEHTQVGELMVRGLVRAQLGLALSLAAVVVALLGSLPVVFAIFPELTDLRVLGLRLPWLLLGVLAYPLLFAVGWLHVRASERIEDDFGIAVGEVEDEPYQQLGPS